MKHTGTNSVTSNVNYLLQNGATITVTLRVDTAWLATRTTKISITNIKLEEAVNKWETEINYTSGGTVTANDQAIVSGDKLSVSESNGVNLIASPNTGYEFYGWIDANSKLLSTERIFTYYPTAVGSVKAIFGTNDGTGTAIFKVDNTYLSDDLNVAATKGSKIVLMNNATLPAGTYTIPSGDVLLIPFNAAHDVYTTTPKSDDNGSGILSGDKRDAYANPTPFKKLTMADGANIIVNGAISISGKHHAGGSANNTTGSLAGAPTGPVGFIHMNEGSNITLNNGAKLYAWGYITGKGNVTAKSGSEVFENFIIQDFRGGKDTTHLTDQTGTGVFVLSQYYVQNIEAYLTLEYCLFIICIVYFYK